MYNLKTLIVWILTPIFEIIFFLWNALKSSKCAVLNAFKETDPSLEVQGFCDYLDSSIHDVISEGSQKRPLPLERCTYGDLMESLKKQPNYALIYLHDNSDDRCLNFCRSTLHHLNDGNFFESSECKLWACSLQTSEGRRVCQTLRARIFPFLALIGFKHNQPIILLKLPGCEIGHAELRAKMLRVMNDNQIHMDEAKIDKQERDAARLIRLSQDEEYNRSLSADRRKEALRREKEEQERKQVEEENQRRLEKEKIKDEMRSKLLPEPDSLQGDNIRILLRFGNGTRLERRFSKKHPLQQLYAFACLQEACPDDFEIVATFPRRLVPCDPNSPSSMQTFEEFNFGKTETLFVNEL